MRCACAPWRSAGRSSSRRHSGLPSARTPRIIASLPKKLLADAARRPQVGRAEGQWLPPVQRIRHVDVDVDELNAGLCLGVPRPAVPPPVAKPNVRHPGEVEAAPVALRRQPRRAVAAELKREHGLLPELLVAQDVRAHLAITSTVDASDLLARAAGFPDEAIDRARPRPRWMFVGPATAARVNPSRHGMRSRSCRGGRIDCSRRGWCRVAPRCRRRRGAPPRYRAPA